MSGPTQQAIDWTPIYESLADEQRRELLQFLAQTTGAVDIDDVAEHLQQQGDQAPTDGRLDRIELRLHHVHLPRLAETGLVEWDPDERTADLTALGLQLPVAILRPQLSESFVETTPESASTSD